MPDHGCCGSILSPEKYGNDIPARPAGASSDDAAYTRGMTFTPYFSLSVELSGTSVQSCVVSPITIELRIVIVGFDA